MGMGGTAGGQPGCVSVPKAGLPGIAATQPAGPAARRAMLRLKAGRAGGRVVRDRFGRADDIDALVTRMQWVC